MVFVVERYLPGLSRSDLLRRLARLERTQERSGEAPGVRYLGSTVVLEDESCFCQFEGPTEAAVAEANRRAGLPFDRIVSAVSVQPERRETMSVSATIPPTVQIRRGRFIGLVCGVAAVAAAITWAVYAFGVDNGTGQAQASVVEQPAVTSSPIPMTGYLDGITSNPTVVEDPLVTSSPIPMTGYLDGITSKPSVVTGSPSAHGFRSIMSFSPAELSAGALWGYALPSTQSGLTRESVLSLLDPQSRRYVEAVTGLTFQQLAAGAAGAP